MPAIENFTRRGQSTGGVAACGLLGRSTRLYTGARREEVAKIMVDDVAMIEGIWALKVRVTKTERVKTESPVRDFPLADEVTRLRFLKFVEHQR